MVSRKKFIELNAKLAVSSFVLSQFPFKGFTQSKKVSNERINGLTNTINKAVPINFFDALKDYRIVQSYDTGNLLIMAYELTDDLIGSLPNDRNIAIYCFKASINSPITFNGKNLYLLAGKIASNNITINVSGANGRNCNPIQKPSAGGFNNTTNPNNPGWDATNLFTDDNGQIIQGDRVPDGPMNGKNGGDVFIGSLAINGNLNISSNGGNGGLGQQGANGRSGADFTNANPNYIANLPNHTIPGYPAENGGSGAQGGLGGNGGNIVLYCSDNIAGQKLIANTVAAGGKEGDSGTGGGGGAFGGKGLTVTGQRNPNWPTDGRPFMIFRNVPTKNSGPGQIGPTPPKSVQRNGQNGSIAPGKEADFYKYLPYDFAKLLMLKAESLYLNADFDRDDQNLNDAYELLNFLLKVSSNNPGIGFIDQSAVNHQYINQNLFYLQGYQTDSHQWAFLYQKCLGYIAQITLNLDLFGNPYNYAPTLNADYLIANYIQALPLIAGFRDFANKLTQQQTELQLDEFKNDGNLKQCQTNIDQLTNSNTALAQQIININLDLQQRFVIIENLKAGLVQDQNDLNAAILNDGGCGLSEIFHCLTAVVAIATAIYTCGAATVAAVSAVGSVVNGLSAVDSLSDLKKTLTDSNSLVRKGISDISKDVGTAEDSITKITTIYNNQIKKSPEIPDSLIGVDTAKFDATIDKYTGKYNQAQKYKDDYHAFVDYVNVTNQTRIKITSYAMQINQNYQNIQLLTQQQNDLRTASTMDNASKLSLSNKMSLFDLYYKTRGYAINLIYLQNKSLNYQLPDLNLANDTYDDYSIETLNTDVYKNNWQQVLSLNAHNFSRISNVVPLKIKFKDQGNSYTKFTNQLTDSNGLSYFSFEFNIKPSNPDLTASFQSDKKNIKIMGIQAILNSTRNYNAPLTFRITHLGNSTITLDKDFKNEKAFVHESKTANLTSSLKSTAQTPLSFGMPLADGSNPKNNMVGENFVSGDNITLGVSPFATWKLEIYPSDNSNLSNKNALKIIKNLESIDLYFWYYFQFV